MKRIIIWACIALLAIATTLVASIGLASAHVYDVLANCGKQDSPIGHIGAVAYPPGSTILVTKDHVDEPPIHFGHLSATGQPDGNFAHDYDLGSPFTAHSFGVLIQSPDNLGKYDNTLYVGACKTSPPTTAPAPTTTAPVPAAATTTTTTAPAESTTVVASVPPPTNGPTTTVAATTPASIVPTVAPTNAPTTTVKPRTVQAAGGGRGLPATCLRAENCATSSASASHTNNVVNLVIVGLACLALVTLVLAARRRTPR